jgi:ribonuclease P protein component
VTQVLPASARLRRGTDYALVLRRGRSSGRPTLVAHLLVLPVSGPQARVGFVVGRGVGTAVVRNRVRRRMRHLCAARLTRLPAASLLVVRARPAAASASSAELGADLDSALVRLLPAGRAAGGPRLGASSRAGDRC